MCTVYDELVDEKRGYIMSVSFSQMVILFILIGGPLLLPLLTKKWTWFITMIIGYAAYILCGIYLHSTSDITEYGTGYGIFIVPYVIGISILGAFLHNTSTQNQKS
ncbi:hypothetical protein [Cytobacillus luteolus]|nr:hypothetical protein [Cytobacillus luteolus]